jgi:hypothetical protein
MNAMNVWFRKHDRGPVCDVRYEGIKFSRPLYTIKRTEARDGARFQ